MRLLQTFAVFLLALPLTGQSDGQECVALLHGLWRTENSMNKMADQLEAYGFRVANIAYGSRDATIGELALETLPLALDSCNASSRVHFVTHSMGGILLRNYLHDHDIPGLGRSVMLGPPNQGSEVIDRYAWLPGFEWFSGPAGLQLGTGRESVPRSLGPVQFEVGIIAGNRSLNPILSLSLPGPDDGKVSVDATRVEGAADHIEMDVNHVFMMRDEEVIQQVIHFLEHGQFKHDVAYLNRP